MKAMLYADWLNFRQSLRSIFFVLVVFAATAFVYRNPMFFAFIVVFLSIMLPTTMFTADQAYGWNRLSLSLPILRRDVVGSKFVLSALANLVLAGLGLCLSAGYTVYTDPSALSEAVFAILVCEAVALTMLGLLLVLSFRFGIEKARYIIMGCVWVPVLLIFVLEKFAWFTALLDCAGAWLNAATLHTLTGAACALLAGSVAVYAVCWGISVRLYRKTEL